MLGHYVAAAFAKFARAPFSAAANVLTLAIGLACFITAYGIASWWRLADHYHPNSDRIFVVGQSIEDNEARTLLAASSPELAPYLAQDFDDLEQVARATTAADIPFSAPLNKAALNVATVDAAFVDIFELTFVAGDAQRALREPQGIVLTEGAAARLFGGESALGQPIRVDGAEGAIVTGVVAEPRQPSFMGSGAEAVLRFDALRPWTESQDGAENWLSLSSYTFVTAPPGLETDVLNERLAGLVERRVPEAQRQFADVSFNAFPVGQLKTRAMDGGFFTSNGLGLSATSALVGLGILTLAIACANYANLATAQAIARTREIGMRKAVGAAPRQIMLQFWTESALLTAIAAGVALTALAAVAPIVEAVSGIQVLYFMSQGAAPAAAIVGLTVLVAGVAGFYPALVQSRVQPGVVLTGARVRLGTRRAAHVLVGVQFFSASLLLIVATVMQFQRAEVERAALSAQTDVVVVLDGLRDTGVDFETLDALLDQHPGIVSTSTVDFEPWAGSENIMPLSRSPEADAFAAPARLRYIGHDYFTTLGVGLLAGRAFDAARDPAPVPLIGDASREFPVVIDRAYAESLGFATPEAAVGEIVRVPESFTRAVGMPPARPVQIVGVTETEMTHLASSTALGNVYAYSSEPRFGGWHPLIRIAADDAPSALAAIGAAWDRLAPELPANIQFYDEMFERSYRSYTNTSRMFLMFVGAAFLVASLGLLGIAAHVASRRRHEVAVRKTLGADVPRIFLLLLWDFSKPVLVANLLAWPLGYLAANIYLSGFDHRVTLTLAPFALSMTITLAIALAAVLGEVLKVASVRPVEVLRSA